MFKTFAVFLISSACVAQTANPKPVAPAAATLPTQQYDVLPTSDAEQLAANYLILQYNYTADEKQLEVYKQNKIIDDKFNPQITSAQTQLQNQLTQIALNHKWDPSKVRFNTDKRQWEVKHGESPTLPNTK